MSNESFTFEIPGKSESLVSGILNYTVSGEYKLEESKTVEVSSMSTSNVIIESDAGQVRIKNESSSPISYVFLFKSTELYEIAYYTVITVR